jgi:hypothetical protein
MGRRGGKFNHLDHTSNTSTKNPKQAPTPQPQATTTKEPNEQTEDQPMDIYTEHQQQPTEIGNTSQKASNNADSENTKVFTSNPKRTNSVNYQHNYRMLIKAFPNEKETETFTRLHVIQIVRQALQACNPDTCLLLPADNSYQQRTYHKINLSSKNTKIEYLLHSNQNGTIQGTIQLTSNTK